VTGIQQVEDAARRLAGVSVRTPLLRCFELEQRVGGVVLLKPECLQRTGSFKIRGAYNLMSQLSKVQAKRGVVAWSSGNHAQGVAAAGRLLDIPTTIVMPEDAPKSKLANTQRLGGEVITYDRYTGDREAIARNIAAERGAEIVPSYDHEHIIAGQGTVGLEIAQQCQEAGLLADQVLICCGGGGLTAGSAVALTAKLPGVAIHTVEPDEFDDTARSLALGKRVCVVDSARTICDALMSPCPGEMTFEINRQLLSDGLSVSDEDVREAMRFAFKYLKLVVEPGGAVALAAMLTGKINGKGMTTVVVLSGGNVDSDSFAEIQRSGSG
jgi:threonine dehydratase